jgi:hypothetical protein
MKYAQPFGIADPNAPYINDDQGKGIDGSVPGAECVEYPMREIEHLIKNSQQIPTDDDLEQVTRAVRDGRLNFYIDQGTTNAIVLSQLSPPITSYEAGLEVRVLVLHSVTGATTIQIGDLAPTGVKRLQGTDLLLNDLLAGQVADLVCDGTNFQVQNLGIADHAGAGDIDRYEVYLPYVHDTGTVNHLIGLYSPPLPDIHEGRTVEIKLANNTTGPVDFTPNNFPTYPVAHPDGSPMFPGDGVINQIWLLVFDGAEWQLISQRSEPTAVVVTRPKRSLQFQDPNAGWWGTYAIGSLPLLKRTPSAAGNTKVWTFSTFIRWPVLIPRPNFYLSYAYDLREFIVSAGDSGASWAGGAGDVTCLEFAGGDIDTMLAAFWANTYAANTGYSDPDSVTMGYSSTVHNGAFLWGVLKDTNWHHLLWRADSVTLHQEEVWLDGVRVNVGSLTANSPSTMNAARIHFIGAETGPEGGSGGSYGCRARMAEVCMVDGQWLDWTFFASNIGGVFVPRQLAVSSINWGVNGYYLNWSDGSAATETTMGKDYSGKGNNWTPINMTTTRIHLDYPGNPDSTETFGAFTNGGSWPLGHP